MDDGWPGRAGCFNASASAKAASDGQHSVEVLHDAWLSAGEIEKLIAEGSVIDAKLG